MTGPNRIEMWSEHGNLEVPTPEGVTFDSLHADLKKGEIRAYADGKLVAKLSLEDAVDAMNDRWRTREGHDGEPLDDWNYDPETGEVA